MRVAVVVGILVLGGAGPSGAQPPEPGEIRKPHMVVLATAKDEASGRKEANRAASRLGYAVAPDTLSKPSSRRVYVGAVITLQRSAEQRFEVVSYLGDQDDAKEALATAREHYPAARIVPAHLPKDATTDWIEAPFYRLGILVVGSFKSYEAALRAAKSFSSRSGQPYDSRGLIHDKQRGLIWPDSSEDETWAGQYAPRREDACDVAGSSPCVTVERSEGYEDFTPGLYIVVAGVLRPDDDGPGRLAAARKLVPGAYLKQTTIYLGCMH